MSTFRVLLVILVASLCLANARADITVEPQNDHQPNGVKILPEMDQTGSSPHEFTETAEVEVSFTPELDSGLGQRMGQPQIVNVAGDDGSNVVAILAPKGGAIDVTTSRLLFLTALLGMAASLHRCFSR